MALTYGVNKNITLLKQHVYGMIVLKLDRDIIYHYIVSERVCGLVR